MDADHRPPDEGAEKDGSPPSPHPSPDPSAGLIKGLEALYAQGPRVPSEVDERILAMAREQMPAPATTSARAGSSRSGASTGVLARIGPRHLKIGGGVGALLAASIAVAFWLSGPGAPKKDQLAFEGQMDADSALDLGRDDFADRGLRSSPDQREFRRESAQAPMAPAPMAQAPAEPSATAERSRRFANNEQEGDAVDELAKLEPEQLALADRVDAPAPADDTAGAAVGGELAEQFAAENAGQGLADLETSDVDGNGALDILDAFALARAIEDGVLEADDLTWDLNQDGKVDASDVTTIALAVVSLDRAPSARGSS